MWCDFHIQFETAKQLVYSWFVVAHWVIRKEMVPGSERKNNRDFVLRQDKLNVKYLK